MSKNVFNAEVYYRFFSRMSSNVHSPENIVKVIELAVTEFRGRLNGNQRLWQSKLEVNSNNSAVANELRKYDVAATEFRLNSVIATELIKNVIVATELISHLVGATIAKIKIAKQ